VKAGDLGALALGGAAGYAVARWLVAPSREAEAATPAATLAPEPVPSPKPIDEARPISSPSQVEGLPRDFDPIFERYRGAIPIEYLRALAKRESGMNAAERSGPAWGLMQIVEVVRRDYNEAHGTQYTREQLLEPDVSVAMCCWLLRFIIESYARNHPGIPNLRVNWDNPRFVELLTFGWNAGFSEKAGVGKVVGYLESLGARDVDLDQVHAHAKLARASRHLSNAKKVAWCKSVVRLYEKERGIAPRNARSRSQRYALEGRTILKDGQAIARLDRVDLGNERYAISPHETDVLAARVVGLLNGKRGRRNKDTHRLFVLRTYPDGRTRWYSADPPTTWEDAKRRLVAAGVLDDRVMLPTDWKLVADPPWRVPPGVPTGRVRPLP
jgi:hypothetical protein